MDPKEIKKTLIDLDISQADIARQLNLSRQTVNREIQTGRASSRVRQYIKDLIITNRRTK